MNGWSARVDGMIHPRAASDPFLLPLHKSFLIFCFVSGATALLVLPLHLALAGPPQAAMILVLAWMLIQWPLAMYLSQSGDIDRSIGLSASLFASFIAAICVLSGGIHSFALPWLIIPPAEAAFSTKRKTAFLVTALCAVLLAAIAIVEPNVTIVSAQQLEVGIIATLAALVYVGLMAQRISHDRNRARFAVRTAEVKRQLISQNTSDVFCELDNEGNLEIVGGPAVELFGALPSSCSEDWIFKRLHVADRPLYLTKLSDVRNGGAVSAFEVRMRVGASVPGERGHAEHRQMEVQLRSVQDDEHSSVSENRILVRFSVAVGNQAQNSDDLQASRFAAQTDRISGAIIESANEEASAAFSKIKVQTERLRKLADEHDADSISETAREIDEASKVGTVSLNTVSEFVPGSDDFRDQDLDTVDVAESLQQSLRLLSPIARQTGVAIDADGVGTLPDVLCDEKPLHKSLCYILHEMVETSGNCALVKIAGKADRSFVEITFSVSNRSSSLNWNSTGSRPVLDFANGLLEKSGAAVSTQSNLGHGEHVVLRLPRGKQRATLPTSSGVPFDARPIVQSA